MPNLKNNLIRVLAFLVLMHGITNDASACTPLNPPSLTSQTLTATNLLLNIANNTIWTGSSCPNKLEIEIACNGNAFSGLAADTYTSPQQWFSSTPYSYNTQSISIVNLCAGQVYKFRIRERSVSIPATTSIWSAVYTFSMPGVFVPPTLTLSAFPNLICPPAPVQLSASVGSSGCGQSNYTYFWFPSTGLNNAFIANPVATVTAPITYSCIVSGGASGCWSLFGSLFLNVGTGPPIPGFVSVNPNSLCVYNSCTLSSTAYTGNIQWQSSASTAGPWTNIPGATLPTYVIPSLPSTTCYQAILTSCSGATDTTNITCAVTNSVPILTPSISCSGTVSLLSFTHLGSSGTPTNIIWAPAPLSVNASSTTASYTGAASVFALAQFTDGCISSTNFSLVPPTLTVVSTPVTCSTLATATVFQSNIIGPINYFWSPTAQTTSVATGLFPGNFSVTLSYNNGNCSSIASTSLISSSVITGTVLHTDTLNCNGVPTGTATMLLSGGTGSASFVWTGTNTSQSAAIANGLSAGIYTVTATDLITFCNATYTFEIKEPTASTVNVIASTPSACVGGSALLTANTTGGKPAYTYTWTGGPTSNTYLVTESSAGIHTYSIGSRDANQCLAIRSTSINFINNPVVSIGNITICPLAIGTLTATGANTYTWNGGTSTGNTFTASPSITSFYSVLGSALGCTASASAFIITNPAPVAGLTNNSPICNGQTLVLNGSGGVSYIWSGPSNYFSAVAQPVISAASPSNSGVYTVVATSAIGCTASATASITIYPTPPLTVTGSTVCSNGTLTLWANSVPGNSYSWSGPSFISTLQNPSISSPSPARSGNYTVNIISAQGCSNSAVAHVTVTQFPSPQAGSDGPKCTGASINFTASGGSSYNWMGPNGFNSLLKDPTLVSAPYASNGTYTVVVTIGPCVANVYYYLTIHPLPTATVSNNSPICEEKTLKLFSSTGNTVTTYNWFGPAFYSLNSNPIRDSSKLGHSGIYTLTVTDANGCQTWDTTRVTIMQIPNVSANGATVCLNEPAIITVNGAKYYLWKGPSSYQSSQPSAVISSVNNASLGNYTVTGTAANTCSSIAVVHVGTLSLPSPSILVSPNNTICLNTNVRMEGLGGKNYKWFGPGSTFLDGPLYEFTALNQHASGIYTLVAIDGKGCKNTTTTSINIFPLPQGTLIGDKMEGCVPLCSNYHFEPINTSSLISGSWQIKSQNYPSKFSHCFFEIGTHTVQGTFYDSLSTCRNFVNFYVTVYPVPKAEFIYTPLNPIEGVDDVLFTNTSISTNESKFNWFFSGQGAGESTYESSNQHTSFHFAESGLYPVAMVVTNQWGCTDTSIQTIKVLEDFYVFVPNVFTPNEDIHNEIFIAVTRGIKLFEMQIYNRWGALVFSSKDVLKGWDGSFGDQPCKSDVYTWKIQATSIHNERKEMMGHVTLYR